MNFIQKIKIINAVKYIKKGNINKALAVLNKIKAPSFDEAFYKGTCYYEAGELEKAENDLNRAMKYKEDYNCTRILAEVYLQQGKWEMALSRLRHHKDKEEIRKIIKIIKDEKKRENYIRHNKFICEAMNYIRRREYEKSIDCYIEALKYVDDKANIYNQIGAIYFNYLKDKEKAEEYFYNAFSISPNNKSFKMNYAKIRLSS